MRQLQNSIFRPLILSCLTVASLGVNSVANAECTDSNTCLGTNALPNNSGTFNTAIGNHTLAENTTGRANTAIGGVALVSNTTGNFNTAVGVSGLFMNLGNNNTAIGFNALAGNETGSNNTASGYEALWAFNADVPVQGATGSHNTANGYRALHKNFSGESNTGIGAGTLFWNRYGSYNTANGMSALRNLRDGSRNVALGHRAGYAMVGGNDNIIIGANNVGVVTDTGVIRIGKSGSQTKALIAGIRGVTTGSTTAVPVLIDANGQLGTVKSSRVVKEDILPMGNVSDRLLKLRPVTFRYKAADDDGSKPMQFGLIAEEVAETFPELVVYDAKGKPETVSYHLLATLLLNEFQKERSATQAQAVRIAELQQEFARMAEIVNRLSHAPMVAIAP